MAKQGIYYELVTSQGALHSEQDQQPPKEDVWIRREDFQTNHPDKLPDLQTTDNEEKEETPDQVPFMQVLRMNWDERYYIVLGILGSLISGCSSPAFAILFGEIMGVLDPISHPSLQETKRVCNLYSILFLVIGIVMGAGCFLQAFAFSVSGEYLTSRLRVLSFESMLRQEIAWFDDARNSIGSLCSRLSADASNVQGATGLRIGVVLQTVTSLGASFFLAVYYQWKLALVTGVFIPLVLLSTYLQAKIIMGQDALEKEALEQSAKIAVEAISNIRTVASLRREGTFYKAFMSSLNEPHISARKKAWVRGFVYGFASSVALYAYGVCVYYGGWLIKHEGLDFKSVFKVGEMLIFGSMTISQAVAFAPSYNKAIGAANRIFSLLHRESAIDSTSKSGEMLKQASGSVEFERVRFHYAGRNIAVLQDLNMSIESNQTVALVGPSGCGKSTCIQLLQRFYNTDHGRVAVDGGDIALTNVGSLRQNIGIVSQEPVLFNRTIAENIAYGDNERNVAMDEIVSAARKANVHTFIQSLPLGYETLVGARGTQLSGGQKQRIAIARAVLRNPRILLLDEATSALDTQSEKIVQQALSDARQGRTCITIAHRLSTIRDADNIIVIDKGRVVESGTHQQLMQLKGVYHGLCSVQNKTQ